MLSVWFHQLCYKAGLLLLILKNNNKLKTAIKKVFCISHLFITNLIYNTNNKKSPELMLLLRQALLLPLTSFDSINY